MGNLILPHSVTDKLPFGVTAQLADLPEEAQREFFAEYSNKSRSLSLSYMMQFLFGAHYAYMGKWGLQLLYWLGIIFGIFPGLVWGIIDLFRMPGMIEKHNAQTANDILRHIVYKYKYSRNKPQAQKRFKPNSRITLHNNPSSSQAESVIRPRETEKVEFDPTNLSVENLKKGYLLDYDLKSWEVVGIRQFDRDDAVTERDFTLAGSVGHDTANLFVHRRNGQLFVTFMRPVNIYALHESLEEEILTNQRPFNILTHNSMPFYRENRLEGTVYTITGKNVSPGTRIIVWEYYDGLREQIIRIEQSGRNSFRAMIGRVINPFEVTDILPGADDLDDNSKKKKKRD